MFTLLSAQHKKYLLKQYRLRLLSTVMFFASAMCVAGAALLLPSFVTLYVEDTRLTDETKASLLQITKKNSKGLVVTLKDIKSMVGLVNLDETKVYDVIRVIVAKRPSGVTISAFNYTHNEGGNGIINFQGTASSRSTLISFSKTLQTEKIFENVDLPISNLAKETNVKYTMTITGKF